MESEKVKDIKKALECCGKNNPDCDNCPYSVGGGSLCRQPEQEALTLINELESENERLKTSEFDSCQELDNAFAQIHSLEEHIAELENGKEQTMKMWFEDRKGMFWDGVGEGELKGYKQLKQFAERLKEKLLQRVEWLKERQWEAINKDNDFEFNWFSNCKKGIELSNKTIDETLKEFLNKGDDRQ